MTTNALSCLDKILPELTRPGWSPGYPVKGFHCVTYLIILPPAWDGEECPIALVLLEKRTTDPDILEPL